MFGSIVSGFARRRVVNSTHQVEAAYFECADCLRLGLRPDGSQRFGYLAAAFHKDRVHDVKRAMLDAALAQPLQDGPCVA